MRRNKRRFALGIAIASYILSPAIVVPSTRERDGVSLACNVAKRHLPLILASIGESLSREIENPVAAIGSSAVRAARFPRSSPSPGAPLPSPTLPSVSSPSHFTGDVRSADRLVSGRRDRICRGRLFFCAPVGERRAPIHLRLVSPFPFPSFPSLSFFPFFFLSFFLSFFFYIDPDRPRFHLGTATRPPPPISRYRSSRHANPRSRVAFAERSEPMRDN